MQRFRSTLAALAALASGCVSPTVSEISAPRLDIYVPAMQSRELIEPNLMTTSSQDETMANVGEGCAEPTISWKGSIADFDSDGSNWASNLASMTYCAHKALQQSTIKAYYVGQLYNFSVTPLTVDDGNFPNYKGSFNTRATTSFGQFCGTSIEGSATHDVFNLRKDGTRFQPYAVPLTSNKGKSAGCSPPPPPPPGGGGGEPGAGEPGGGGGGWITLCYYEDIYDIVNGEWIFVERVELGCQTIWAT